MLEMRTLLQAEVMNRIGSRYGDEVRINSFRHYITTTDFSNCNLYFTGRV